MAQLQKDVVWLVLSRSVTVVVVVTWPVLFALAPGSSFHFAPPLRCDLFRNATNSGTVDTRAQTSCDCLWFPNRHKLNQLHKQYPLEVSN